MELDYFQEIVDRLKENTLIELLGDRVQVNLVHYPHPPTYMHEYIAVEVRVGDAKLIRSFTFDELKYRKGPANFVAIEIATMLARAIIVEGV